MKHIEKIKEMLNNELEVFSKKNAITPTDLARIKDLSKSIKNLCEIMMLEEDEMGGSSYARGRGRNAKRDSMGRYSREDGYSEEGGSSYYGGGSSRGSSYEDGMSSYERGGRGGQGGGRGNQGGRSSYRGSSYGGEDMMSMIEEMMEEANPKEREALKECMRALERM